MAAVKRVLLTAEAPDLSGVAFVTRQLAAGLQRRGVESRAWFLRPGPRLGDFAEHGLVAAVHPGYGLGWVGRKSLAEARAFAPDIVHAQSIRLAARSRRMAKDVGAALIVSAHRLDPREGQRFARIPEAGIAAISDVVLERLANGAGIARDRLRVIPNALDLSLYPRPQFTFRFEYAGRLPVIGACGRLAEGKGRRFFLKMAAILAVQGLDAEYVVIGEGPLRGELDREAQELGIRRRVTFAPLADPEQISHLDILVEPSLIEGFGLSILQAMALGVPVVAAGTGGVFSLVDDGATGLLTAPGDPEALAGAVRRLLADPGRRLELARQARDRVEEHFDVNRVAGTALAFYAERREGLTSAVSSR